jgi:hypothetical protein
MAPLQVVEFPRRDPRRSSGVSQDTPRHRRLGRAIQGAGGLLVAGAVAVGASAAPIAAGEPPPSDCGQSEPAGAPKERQDGAAAGGDQTPTGPGAPACDEREPCDSRDEPVEDRQPSDEPAGEEEETSEATEESSAWDVEDPGEDKIEREPSDPPRTDDRCSEQGERAPGSDGTKPAKHDASARAAPQVMSASAAARSRSEGSKRAVTTAQQDDDGGSSSSSMSESRSSGAGQYEPEDPPEAGGSGSGSGKGSGSSGSSSSHDDSGGGLPHTGLAIGALVVTGLALFTFGGLVRRHLSTRRD